jgi:hypothetical protein
VKERGKRRRARRNRSGFARERAMRMEITPKPLRFESNRAAEPHICMARGALLLLRSLEHSGSSQRATSNGGDGRDGCALVPRTGNMILRAKTVHASYRTRPGGAAERKRHARAPTKSLSSAELCRANCPRCAVQVSRCVGCGLRFAVCGLRAFAVCGLRFAVYGLRFTVCTPMRTV